MKDIVIFGAGGLAREIAFLIEDINHSANKPVWNILGFVETDHQLINKQVGKYVVFCAEDDLLNYDETICAVIGIGNPKIIQKIVSKFQGVQNIVFPNIIHPQTIWDQMRIQLGHGNVICAGNILTTDVVIGSFNLINLHCTIGHDTVIHDGSVINPGANISGGVVIHSGCLIGTGATILQYKTIGEGATVGAGTLVNKDVEPGTTVVGVPARVLLN